MSQRYKYIKRYLHTQVQVYATEVEVHVQVFATQVQVHKQIFAHSGTDTGICHTGTCTYTDIFTLRYMYRYLPHMYRYIYRYLPHRYRYMNGYLHT